MSKKCYYCEQHKNPDYKRVNEKVCFRGNSDEAGEDDRSLWQTSKSFKMSNCECSSFSSDVKFVQAKGLWFDEPRLRFFARDLYRWG